MKKTKIDEYIYQMAEDVFDGTGAEGKSGFQDHSLVSKAFEDLNDGSMQKTIFTILRQVFLFFPATFVLWVMTAEFTYMTLMGLRPFYPLPIAIIVISFFIALIGLGDIRRLKDYVIPTSIMSVGVLVASLSWLSGSDILKFNNYGMLFFPLALMAPFIARFLIDRIGKE